jgi:hypothetical protein
LGRYPTSLADDQQALANDPALAPFSNRRHAVIQVCACVRVGGERGKSEYACMCVRACVPQHENRPPCSCSHTWQWQHPIPPLNKINIEFRAPCLMDDALSNGCRVRKTEEKTHTNKQNPPHQPHTTAAYKQNNIHHTNHTQQQHTNKTTSTTPTTHNRCGARRRCCRSIETSAPRPSPSSTSATAPSRSVGLFRWMDGWMDGWVCECLSLCVCE